MAIYSTPITTDEKVWQGIFYEQLFGKDCMETGKVKVDRSTDGYTSGILFEHKQNVQSFGEDRTLGQALIYLTRFNIDGIPVPAKICLVSQDEQKCYVYDTKDFMGYVDNPIEYSCLKASDGIPHFAPKARVKKEVIDFDISSASGMRDMMRFVNKPAEHVPVTVTEHNVYGWSQYYYKNAKDNKQKPEKNAFFDELRDPQKTLLGCVKPWKGKETDFKYIMDMLNDPMTQKKLGAFYTPPEYAKLSAELVKKAIAKVPEGNDYVIIDTCAGGGNLEMHFDDEILSHVIVSTYELKEWIVLRDRFGHRVRYIVPRIPKKPNEYPPLNDEGFLAGANALTREIIDDEYVKACIEDEHCNVIVYINPPYIETTGIEFQKAKEGKNASSWKNSYMVQEMKKEVSGPVTNDMGNVFIWSAFKYYMNLPEDSLIVYSPVKYWKAQHLVNKKFVEGYAFNRKHFHAKTPACVMCAWWSNEDDYETEEIELQAVDLDASGQYVFEKEPVVVKQLHSMFSDAYYDKRSCKGYKEDGILCDLDGLDIGSKDKDLKCRVIPYYDEEILGYLVSDGYNFDSPRLHSSLLISGRYQGNGFYLRKDNFMEKLPVFVASRYTDHCNDWKVMSMVMKSGDKAKEFYEDLKTGELDEFLFKCMFWTCISHYPHMRSQYGSDGRLYLNQLCFDGDTLAQQMLDEYESKGHSLTFEECNIYDTYQGLLGYIKNEHREAEYNPKFKYGLYQIDEEINIKVCKGRHNPDGTDILEQRDGDLNNRIKHIKQLAKDYYINNLVYTLKEYEFVK